MPDTPSITINKQMLYRGQQEVYSNTYHFSGTTPSSDAEWTALAAAIFGAERTFLGTDIRYAGFLGYEAGNNHAVSIRDFVADGATLIAGQASPEQYGPDPRDVAVWVRWRLPTRNSRGKWNYLRKYFHGVPTESDGINSGIRANMNAYAEKMKDGTLPGGARICGEQGAVAGAHLVAPWAGFRQLKRTGKRPSR